MNPRAFISFQMEDRWARDFLVQHAKDRTNDISFLDYSVQTPFDSSWKTKCRERIARTSGTILLVGKTTHQSEAVAWEITETMRQDHSMFGIQIHRNETCIPPAGLSRSSIVNWDFEEIVGRLWTWT